MSEKLIPAFISELILVINKKYLEQINELTTKQQKMLPNNNLTSDSTEITEKYNEILQDFDTISEELSRKYDYIANNSELASPFDLLENSQLAEIWYIRIQQSIEIQYKEMINEDPWNSIGGYGEQYPVLY